MSRHGYVSVVPGFRMLAAFAVLGAVYAGLGWVLVAAGAPALLVAGVAAATVVGQWPGTDWIARHVARARDLTAAEDPDLHAMLDRLCALTGQPKPRLAISENAAPNAFTVGRSHRHSAIIITRGLRERLDVAELDAVLAHELAHIAHRDVVVTVASWLAIALAWACRAILRLLEEAGKWFGGGMAAIPLRDLRAAAAPGLGFVGVPSRFGPLFATHPRLGARLDQLGRLQRATY